MRNGKQAGKWGSSPQATIAAPSAPSMRAESPPNGNGKTPSYQARWISKAQINAIRKSGSSQRGVLIDYRTGFVIVEPVGSNLGDGEVLPRDLADYELREVWCPTSRSKLIEARRLLGLDAKP